MMKTDDFKIVAGILSDNTLPGSLKEAIIELSKDDVIKEALGSVYSSYVKAKGYEWAEYQKQVHEWEVRTYTSRY